MWLYAIILFTLSYSYVSLQENPQVDISGFPYPRIYFGVPPEKPDDKSIVPFEFSFGRKKKRALQNRLWKTNLSFDTLVDQPNFFYGTNTYFLKKLNRFWCNEFDFEKFVDDMNEFPQFTTEIQGIQVHFLHAKSEPKEGIRVMPILLLHGWPTSYVQFFDIIPILLHPASSNIPVRNFAFEVIVPSLPGFAFSEAPKVSGADTRQMALMMVELMRRLGHDKFYVNGESFGSSIATDMALFFPEKIMGLHLTTNLFYTPAINLIAKAISGAVDPTIPENPELTRRLLFALEELGHFHLHATKPDTVGFALQDSPLGIAGYIAEKFSTWTNASCRGLEDGGLVEKFGLEVLLRNIMAYVVTDSMASSLRIYKEVCSAPDFFKIDGAPVTVPTGIADFPGDPNRLEKQVLEQKYINLVKHTTMERGGHFAAIEEPYLLAQDIFSFVDLVEMENEERE